MSKSKFELGQYVYGFYPKTSNFNEYLKGKEEDVIFCGKIVEIREREDGVKYLIRAEAGFGVFTEYFITEKRCFADYEKCSERLQEIRKVLKEIKGEETENAY